jgi:hypothetical protein
MPQVTILCELHLEFTMPPVPSCDLFHGLSILHTLEEVLPSLATMYSKNKEAWIHTYESKHKL